MLHIYFKNMKNNNHKNTRWCHPDLLTELHLSHAPINVHASLMELDSPNQPQQQSVFPEQAYLPKHRRVIEIACFINKIWRKHDPFDCGFYEEKYIGEVHMGLKSGSKFVWSENMCRFRGINMSGVMGIMSVEGGYCGLQKLFREMDMEMTYWRWTMSWDVSALQQESCWQLTHYCLRRNEWCCNWREWPGANEKERRSKQRWLFLSDRGRWCELGQEIVWN